MHKMVKPSMVTLALLLIAAILVFTSGEAEAATNRARADKATAAIGQSVLVKPLANDKIKGKPKAVVKLKPGGNVKAKVVNKKNVSLASTVAGTYRVKYLVFIKNRKVASSFIVFTVKPKTIPPVEPSNTLTARIAALPVAAEVTSGYDRDLYKHWNTGLYNDGCDTRREVLVFEATVKPTLGSSCSFTGGQWYSYYDGVLTGNAGSFDIDHMVPLKESWDSGANTWTADRREAYANDQGDVRSLVAVTAGSNRSKSDRDVAEWMPPLASVHCQYITDWVAVKTRWALTVDQAEKAKLEQVAATCPTTVVDVVVYSG